MKKSFKEKIINSMFIISKKPVLFRDLLEANASFNEGMLVDPSKLNFRFLYGRSYIVFCALWLVVVFPLIAILHGILADIDFHISVLFTMILTASCFVGFDVFKAYARKRVTHRLIRDAWAVHFPYFAYEKYSEIVERIYNESVKCEIPKRDLEKFVLDKLVRMN